jgi:hypothetical protein
LVKVILLFFFSHSFTRVTFYNDRIPSSSIIAKVCPPGMEAGIFSFLAGVSNYGRMVSTLGGAQLIKWSGIVTSPDNECHWGPLPWLLLGGHISLMLVVSIPAAWLIPNIYQTDSTTEHQDNEAKDDDDIMLESPSGLDFFKVDDDEDDDFN